MPSDQDQTVPPEPSSVLSAASPIPSQPPVVPKRHHLWLIVLGLWFIVLLGAGLFYISSLSRKLVVEEKPSLPNVERKNAGKIIIATDATYPPMEFVDDNQMMAGYDIDLGNKIAEKLGVKAEFSSILFDDIFNSLNRREADIILSSVTINEERKQTVDFSIPYLNAGQVIITLETENSIKSENDLSAKRIAVQKGTTSEDEALKAAPPDQVLLFDDFIGATDALIKGEADAIITDLTNAKGIVDSNQELKIAGEPFTEEEYGVVFRKNEDDLIAEINTALNSLRQQGYLVLLKQKWLE